MRVIEERKYESFEAGRLAKPDELEMQVVQSLGEHVLAVGQALGIKPRFNIRIGGGWHQKEGKLAFNVSGEVSQKILEEDLTKDFDSIIIDHYNAVHKSSLEADQFIITYHALNKQATDLARNVKAGDLGYPTALAVARSPLYLPWERYLAVELRDRIDSSCLQGMLADGKIHVESSYYEGVHEKVEEIVLAVEHEKSLNPKKLEDHLMYITSTLLEENHKKYGLDFTDCKLFVNTNGPFVKGSHITDGGHNEAKPHRDRCSHSLNEDSLSGEDPTKVSGTGSFLARYIANQIIHNNLAEYAEVTLRYLIGTNDVAVRVYTAETGTKRHQEDLVQWVRENFPLTIPEAIEQFDLWNPEVYRKTAEASDFFHSPEFAWNKVCNIPSP